MNSSWLAKPFALLYLLCLVPVTAVLLFALQLNTPHGDPDDPPRLVEIPEGAPAARVVTRLHDEGVIGGRWPARLYLALSLEAERIHAGEYRFEGGITTAAAIRRLLDGRVHLRQVTIPEGARADEVADALAAAGITERDPFLAAVADPASIADLAPAAPDLEGFLFPDTYRFPKQTPAAEVVAAMVRRFRAVWETVAVEECAGRLDDPLATVSLASLIEKETGQAEERDLISAVFHNRLQMGMPLQCDPTVIYGLVREGAYQGRLSRADLAHPSPYNTYVHRGLPPGPIANPGAESLRAARCPGDNDFIYFVSMNTGRHHFSRTLREHQAAVQKYQR